MAIITPTPSHDCKRTVMSVHDAMYVLGGKWKISIITCLLYGPRRYSEILKGVGGLSGKMLSRELKEMEINSLVTRSVSVDQPVSVTYELTEYGRSTQPIIITLAEWAEEHRKSINVPK